MVSAHHQQSYWAWHNNHAIAVRKVPPASSKVKGAKREGSPLAGLGIFSLVSRLHPLFQCYTQKDYVATTLKSREDCRDEAKLGVHTTHVATG